MKLCYVSTSIELGAKSRKFHTFIDSVRQFSLTSHVRNDRNDQWLHISTDAQALANLELSATLEKFIALKCLYWNMKQCFFFSLSLFSFNFSGFVLVFLLFSWFVDLFVSFSIIIPTLFLAPRFRSSRVRSSDLWIVVVVPTICWLFIYSDQFDSIAIERSASKTGVMAMRERHNRVAD